MRKLVSTMAAFALGAAGGALASVLVRRAVNREAPPPATVGGPLDDVNATFHDSYGEARRNAELGRPILLVLADALVLYRGERRDELRFSPRAFHVIKSVAHGAVALFADLHERGNGPVTGAPKARLAATLDRVARALASLADADVAPNVAADLRAVLEACLDLGRGALDGGRASAAATRGFAARLGPTLLRLTDHATRIQLDALHARTEEALALLSDDARRELHVVVAGDHQARARSFAMQYFQKRLGEPAGAEDRVTYAEGVTNEKDALALVGTQRLDRTIAAAFFGDEKRLQRDVLGDAAAKRLAEMDLPAMT